MSDYISREAAIEVVCASGDWLEVCDRLEQLPSADVVEVIRCRDCRHYHEETADTWKEPLCSCRKFLCSHPTLPEGFCNYGEAKT